MKAYLYLIILGSSWGLYFSLIKIAVESSVSYWNILLVTSVLITLALLIITAIRRRLPRFSRNSIRFYVVCSLLSYLFPFVLEMFAADNMPASVLTLIATTAPIFTLCLAALMGTDIVNPTRFAGIFFGLVAAALILFPASMFNLEINLFWVSIAFFIPLAYGIHENYVTKYWPEGADSLQIACGEALLALIFMVPVYLFYVDPISILNSPPVGMYAVLGIAAMGILDIYLYFELIRIAGPIFTSQGSYLTAVTGVIWGMVIFDERPDAWIWGSAIFLIAGLYLIHRGGPARPQRAPLL